MRKNILSLSIAAMIGSMGVAQAAVFTSGGAVGGGLAEAAFTASNLLSAGAPLNMPRATGLQLTAGGIGHALITPYYTAQAGNMTVISLVNTDTARGKAVKVRFRGAANSDDVMDFTVFMSPGDVWNGAVSKNASTGIAQFTTNDNTCTLPGFTKGTPEPFRTGRLPTYSTATDLANGTSEGYIEIFNMADIPKVTTDTKTLYSSIVHTNGVPRDCNSAAVLATLVDATDEANAVSKGFSAPTSGLYGNWTIINVAQTTTFSGDMTAIRAVNAGVNGYANYKLSPQNDDAAAAPAGATIDPLLVGGFATLGTDNSVAGAAVAVSVTPANYDLPDLSTPFIAADATPAAAAGRMTEALAVTSISNEYTVDTSVNASTDWVFAMPTRRYSVAVAYGASAAAAAMVFSKVAGPTNPNNAYFHTGNTAKASASSDRICVKVTDQKFYDREEGGKSNGAVFSPGSVTKVQFCGEDSILTFGAGTSVLGATLATQAVSGSSIFTSGWGVVNTVNGGLGLPILGASFIKLTNPAASSGVSGTYGISSSHRFTTQ